ncbi:MAG: M23 family metallopeptidase, partial [Pirellula sp.]
MVTYASPLIPSVPHQESAMFRCVLALSILFLTHEDFRNEAAETLTKETPLEAPLFQVVDLDLGEETMVRFLEAEPAKLKLISVEERRDSIRDAVRSAKVVVELNGKTTTLTSGNYELPIRVGNQGSQHQIDCPITSGYNSNGTPESWGLIKRARLRIWLGDSSWMPPGSFTYPIQQRWFASMTQMANEPTYVDGGEPSSRKKIYYHSGLDIGGSEGQSQVIAATEGLVVSVGTIVLEEFKKDSPVEPRYDVVYLRDARGWFYRYSHLKTIDPTVVPGRLVSQGDRIG